MTDDRQFFLSTLPAGRRERRLALAFVLVSVESWRLRAWRTSDRVIT